MGKRWIRGATGPQRSYIARLAVERQIPAEPGSEDEARMGQLAAAVRDGELVAIDLDDASAIIDWLRSLPRVAPDVPEGVELLRDCEEHQGVYRQGRDIYVVKLGPSGYLYAKRLLDENGDRILDVAENEPADPDGEAPRFIREPAPGMARRLTTADRLSLAEARDLMARYRRCLYCSHKLETDASLARMTGTVCKGRFAA